MTNIAVRGLSKRFTLQGRSPQYRSVQEWFSFRRTSQPAGEPRSFLALDGLTFETQAGEVVGIIGRNGAGKSTLLKILSRIVRPTTGSVRLDGRVGSLLEVGSGFHPELTGRENIFLNGAILGMSHSEIRSRFDEIVAFAGVDNYLDEPVKHYSSGMYMRLAFAVAAHIEPEILLLDEVLAVGDAEFQKKCLRKLDDVGRRGRTVLLVSHNVQAVLRFCSRAILLEGGRIIEDGPVKDVVATWLRRSGGANGERIYAEEHHAPGDEHVRLRSVRVRSRAGETQTEIDIGEEFGIEVELRFIGGEVTLFPLITINNEWGPVLSTNDVTTAFHGGARPPGLYRFTAWVPANLLAPGSMTVSVSVHSFRTYRDTEHLSDPDAVSFVAMETREGAKGHFGGYMGGVVRPLLPWTAELLTNAQAKVGSEDR